MKLISNYIYINNNNIDTDIIIPKQFLNTLKQNGFENCLFFDLRYILINNNIKLNFDFKMNIQKSKILITNKNFGCGSSREHAVWAIKDFGYKIIIAESYSNIFYDNSMKNNLLLITLNIKKINIITKCEYLYINIYHQFIKFKNNYLYFYLNKLYKNIFINNFSIIGFVLKKKYKIINFLKK
ncbi:3-isopropylmalate dehydratase small subunit [Candidatus Carsonella ruddii HT isolate Thao2000]|uniref:3-isopropylmalate dehydratase n=1 Tax=Candidatus Carsonella ruddii HT isolate Thao2000 TaxID=1202539 RepID=J3TEG3_CARRU|nr:3-isopropylmalate dehydratase small subunit [Candidatus Carsonella ruddii]AFP84127.1 3-isopropylmalate dehydratase small subunit [Candidatus Carsonella ruddii HT isolate Thao2000]